MSRNMHLGFFPLTLSRRLRRVSSAALGICSIALVALALFGAAPLQAQQGEGGIQGTINDPTGARVKSAKVTATNTDTGVQVTRISNGQGDYSLNPLQPGHYNIEVVARGFQRLLQEDVQIDALKIIGLNLKLTLGSDSTTITITDAPPMLDTQDASIGGTIENELYTELPLSMGGAPRDPTAFAFLMPGVQESAQGATGADTSSVGTGVYGGSGQENLNENYIDGVPVTNVSAGGDPTPIKNAVSVDAVDQFQVKTNGASVGFGGIGVTNYTIKAGGNALHGTVFDYIRNTMFDTWGYFSKNPNANGYATKPGEHQNSYGGSLGGPIIKDKLFYFFTYEGFHYTKVSNTPQYLTVPSLRERGGDFTDAFGTSSGNTSATTYGIYDPTDGRQQFDGVLNGVPTYNVIPASEISSISQYLAKALPAPNSLSTSSNYLAGLPLQNNDYTIDTRLDYTISARNKLSIVGVGGNHGFGTEPNYGNLQQIPYPYAAGSFQNSKTASGVITYTYVASQSLINSLKYGYSRTWGKRFSITQNSPYTSTAAGITGLPPGQAQSTFPAITFSAGVVSAELAPTNWKSTPSSGALATNSYTIIDNVQWIRGRHNITIGAQMQWLGTNQANYAGYSNPLSLTYNGNDTESLAGVNSNTGGSAYASFLIGVVYSGNVSTQLVEDYGGRYRPIAPYVEDDWRATPKLTLNLGLRYDYLTPYREVKDRISFINPTTINPITGTPGVTEYAGFGAGPNPSYSPYICQCHSPVNTYYKNVEPRLGFAYAIRQDTVIRGNWGIMNTHAGGTGGGSGGTGNTSSTVGTGNNSEFTQTSSWGQVGGSTGTPAFFLNPSIVGTAPAVYGQGQPGGQATSTSIPVYTPAGTTVNPLGTTGNYLINPADASMNGVFCPAGNNNTVSCQTSTQNFADPYYGGRGPQFVNYNLGFQQMINRKAVLSITYAGSQTHFLPHGSGRGPATNGISPDYGLEFGPYLAGAVTPAVVAVVQQYVPNFHLPYPAAGTNYAAFGGLNATLSRALSAFPQFNGFTDIWGETGNTNYNAVQFSVIQRPWHNLSGFMNYTRSKTVDDTGTHRTQYPVGPQDGNFTRYYTANEIDRGLSNFNQTNAFNLTWVYVFPIGRGQKFFGANRIASLIGGGWQLSGIYKYRDGNPLAITGPSCNAGQGTCLPDYTPGFDGRSARINGRYGRGPGANASNVAYIQYLNPAAFVCPDSPVTSPEFACNSGDSKGYKLGNIAKSAPYGLTGPGWWDIDLGIRRTFNVIERSTLHLTFQVEGDVINTTNSTFFNLGSKAWNGTCAPNATFSTCSAASYGTISGQNQNVPPRDWQFAGRFRF
jgi:hypothetical protein